MRILTLGMTIHGNADYATNKNSFVSAGAGRIENTGKRTSIRTNSCGKDRKDYVWPPIPLGRRRRRRRAALLSHHLSQRRLRRNYLRPSRWEWRPRPGRQTRYLAVGGRSSPARRGSRPSWLLYLPVPRRPRPTGTAPRPTWLLPLQAILSPRHGLGLLRRRRQDQCRRRSSAFLHLRFRLRRAEIFESSATASN